MTMSIRFFKSNALRWLAAVACAAPVTGCGSDLLRTGRSPVMLVITQIEGAAGHEPEEFVGNLMSDVQVLIDQTVNGVEVKVPTIFNDIVRIQLEAIQKDQSGVLNPVTGTVTSPLNNVTITRYRVNYRRTDGRNTPGVDVPFGFDGAVTTTIPAGGSGEVLFDIVRHQAKLDPPLRNLVGFKGLGFIHTIADITLWGRDQNGNEVTVSGSIDVQFSDFGDEE
jgi:hypothetical protein